MSRRADREILLPAAALALLALALLVRSRSLVQLMQSNADLVAPMAMAHAASAYAGSTIVLGNYGWYPGIWAAQLLGHLPVGAHQAVAIVPGLLTVLAFAAVAWRAARVWERRWAAVVVLALALAAGPATWAFWTAWSGRATTWWAMAAGAVAVVAAVDPRASRATTAAAAAVAVGFGAVCLAGDALVYPALIVPAIAAALAAGRPLMPRTGAVVALAAVTFGLSRAIRAIATHLHYVHPTLELTPRPPADVLSAIANVPRALRVIYGGAHLGGVAGVAGAVVVTAALVAGVVLLARSQRCTPARRAWLAFWVTAGLALIAAFVATTASGPPGQPVPRYLHGLPLVGAALLCAVRPRRLVSVAVSVVALLTAAGLLQGAPPPEGSAHLPILRNVLAQAQAAGAVRGYGSYWTAYPLEEASDYRLQIMPVEVCRGGPACPFYLHYVTGAYRPVDGPSFLLIDHTAPAPQSDFSWLQWLPAGMTPVRTVGVGDGVEMAIFDHDIARDLAGFLPVREGAG